jgi:ABC-type Mn2+/Zn2+ transport system ATPase subunit
MASSAVSQPAELAAARGDTALRVRDVTVDLGDRRVLENVSFDVPPGVVVGLVGPNGAGKTTLLRTIVGMLEPVAGTIQVAGSVGYMPQLGPAAWDFPLSAGQVALQGAYRRAGWLRWPSRTERARAQAALAAVGIDDLAGRQVGELSGGQRQRVLLARTLVQDAAVLLLDEPLSGADAATQSLFSETLATLRREGRSVVISTHDLSWTAERCDLLCLLAGRVHAFGPPRDTLTADCLSKVYGASVLDVGGVRILAPEGHHEH